MGAERTVIVIVDGEGLPLARPDLELAVGTLVDTHLAPIPSLRLPVVLKLPTSGSASLLAYASDNRGLKVTIPVSVLKYLTDERLRLRATWELRRRVVDLAANFRSRLDGATSYYPVTTRTHLALTNHRARRPTPIEHTPVP